MDVSTGVPSPPTVFLLTHEFYPRRGGIATFAEEIARAGAGLGYDVEVWAQAANGRSPEKPWPFRLRRLPLKGTHDFWCQFLLGWQLIRERRRLRRAVVYLAEPGPMLAMMALQGIRTFRPERLVLTFHGSEILKFAHHPWRRGLARKLIARATRISTLTKFTQNLLLTHFPEAASKIVLTPGAPRTGFATISRERAAPGRKLVVLTVGRLHPRKGQLLTLQALQRLAPPLRAQLEYWIVGSQSKDGCEATLRATAAAQPDPAVRFLGDVADDELSGIYERADIFAMTSIDHGHSIEGFGLVYLEASAHGLPVVAHDVGGVSEAVVDGATGLLVRPDRPAALTAAFAQLILDEPLRRRLGDAGRAWALRHRWADSAATLFQPDLAKP